MTFNQSGKSQITGPVALVEKSLEQLPVGQPNGCPGVEEQFHVSKRGYLLSLRHRAGSPRAGSNYLGLNNVAAGVC
jgi:hypothetical protein